MKFLKLDLLRFGPFTDVSLPLDDGHVGLHIVFGPNEAGKSSALRALKQLLFGIPHNSSDNFIHANPNLRIGALLETADGQRIECIRRKGRTQTLRAADDVEAVDPAKLIEALGSIDEATFSQRFGIDYRELVRGGRSIAQGGGDLGEILFAAGTGVADVRHVQSQIESEVQELFKPGGSNPRINDALKRLKNAYDAIKRAQLPTSTWIEHDERLKLAAQRQTHIDQQLLEMRSQESRLGRVNEALPLIGSRDRLQKQLAEVAEAPLLPDNFSVERGERTTQLKNAELAERNAINASEKLAAAIAELTAPKGLLEHRTAITRLHTDLGSYQKAAKDRPTLVAQLAQAEQQANTILCDLGRGLDIARAEELRLSRAQRQHIQSLAGDYKARLDKRRSTELAVSRLGDQIDGAVSQMAAIPPTKDLGEIKRAIRSAQKQGNLDQLLAEARSGLRQLEKQAEIELNKMRLWSGTLEQVERLPVPFLETIERFENEFADAAAAIKRIEDRINELRQQAQKLDQNLEKLRLAHDVPTEDDLAVARQKREFGWQLVRQVWQDGLPIEHQSIFAFIDEISPGTDLAHSFQTSVEAADGLADRLRREADHVAAKAKLTSDRQDLDRQLAEQAKQLVLAEKVGEVLQTKWRDQWTDLNVDPLSPREMRSWHNQQEKLAAIAETIRKKSDIADEAAARVRVLREDLIHCLKQLGQPLPHVNERLEGMLERCENVVAEIETINQARQEHDTALQKLRSDLSEANRNAAQALRELDRWQMDWAEAVKALGLDRDAPPAEAIGVIELIDKLFELLKEANDKRARIDGIEREARDFRKVVQPLLVAVADDLWQLPVDQAVADLYDRLQAASTAQTKLEAWNEQLQIEESNRDEARAQISQLQAEMAAMCREAQCSTAAELPNAERRSSQRQSLERELRQINEKLLQLAAAAPLDDFIAAARREDADQLQPTIRQLGDEIARLEAERTEVLKTIGSEQAVLQQMDGSGRAAEAQEQAEELLARIRSDAEQYVRLRLASTVLSRVIERFRDENKGPVLQRASELFRELTLGSFAGLRADYNEKGEAVLVGVRAGGQTAVGVEGMSDGTCDQLYLALRLASLETYFVDQRPLPFIVDDILIMFDDDRAIAALKALVRLSQKTQVIFFTHHEHLVHIARENLDPDALFTHTLDHRSTVAPRADNAKI